MSLAADEMKRTSAEGAWRKIQSAITASAEQGNCVASVEFLCDGGSLGGYKKACDELKRSGFKAGVATGAFDGTIKLTISW